MSCGASTWGDNLREIFHQTMQSAATIWDVFNSSSTTNKCYNIIYKLIVLSAWYFETDGPTLTLWNTHDKHTQLAIQSFTHALIWKGLVMTLSPSDGWRIQYSAAILHWPSLWAWQESPHLTVKSLQVNLSTKIKLCHWLKSLSFSLGKRLTKIVTLTLKVLVKSKVLSVLQHLAARLHMK